MGGNNTKSEGLTIVSTQGVPSFISKKKPKITDISDTIPGEIGKITVEE